MKQIFNSALFFVGLALMAVSCSQESSFNEVFSIPVFSKWDNGVETYRIPAIVQAQDGSIVAFCEARHDGIDDIGDIDIVARRSTDGGLTWGETIMVWDDANGDVCQNPSPVVVRETGRILLLATWNKITDRESAIHARQSVDTRRVYLLYSDDNGQTWSEPREITSSVKLEDWTWYATGPCHATQLQTGEHKGRIVVPCNHGEFGNWTLGHVIYSDDGGETWGIGGVAGSGNESTVTELANGDVMLNMRGRRSDGGFRRVAVSHDGGSTFDEPYHDEGLEEPVCNASIINYTLDGIPTETLLFSNPPSKVERECMTIKRSKDSGLTWEPVYQLSDLPGAYSDLLVLPDGSVAILYETGVEDAYERIDFVRIPASHFAD